jgi:octaprenyl-diphosphate synthase
VTLPTLCYLAEHPDDPAVRRVLENPTEERVQEAVRTIAASPAIEQALQTARQYVGQARSALGTLAESPYRTALLELADFTVRRQF